MGTNNNNEPNQAFEYIGISQEPCHPTNILWTDEPWRGRVLYTGLALNVAMYVFNWAIIFLNKKLKHFLPLKTFKLEISI